MSVKKKILLATSYAAVAALAVGGTIAYFTAEDGQVNVMTIGKGISIEMNEQQVEDGKLVDFEQGKTMLPANSSIGDKETLNFSEQYPDMTIRKTENNYVEKIVSVTNTGETAAYVRTIYAFPEAGDFDTTYNAADQWFHWNGYSDTDTANPNGWMWGRDRSEWPGNTDNWDVVENVTIDGKVYDLYIATNKNPLEGGKTTSPSLAGFFLDSKVDCQVNPDGSVNYTWNGYNLGDISTLEVLVYTQAVQAEGFDNAWDALDAAFGDITAENHPWTATAEDAVTKYTTAGTYWVNDNIIIAGGEADCIEADGEDVIVNITGGQYTSETPDCAVWVKNGATVNISGGYFKCGARDTVDSASHSDLIYVGAGGGTINISGGFFTAETAGDWLLNLKDNQGGNIVVTGGTFVNWNPTDNVTENPAYNYVADGYTVVEETKANGDVWYTVVAE